MLTVLGSEYGKALLGGVLLFTATTASSAEQRELVTSSGYATQAWVAAPEREPNPVGIVFVHGKRGNPESGHNERFIEAMTDAGYQVVAPLMPWSEKRGYQGSREQALDVIAEAAETLGTERAVVVGHSMGAMGVLQFGAERADEAVAGLVAVAPGHDPHLSGKLRRISRARASEACQWVDEGRGEETGEYPELNKGRQYSIEASAAYYCSFYSTDRFPATGDVAFDVVHPVLWVSGEDDRLTKVYAHKTNFDALGGNSRNAYLSLSGKHKSVLYRHVDRITAWIEAL